MYDTFYAINICNQVSLRCPLFLITIHLPLLYSVCYCTLYTVLIYLLLINRQVEHNH